MSEPSAGALLLAGLKPGHGGTWVISCYKAGFLSTENVHSSPFTLKIFSIVEPVKTCYSLGFSIVRNLYPFCSFCMPQFLAL